MKRRKVAIDCDNAATGLKNNLFQYLEDNTDELNIKIVDLAFAEGKENITYPEIGFNLAKRVQAGEFSRGILLCGTGLGMSIIANKLKGVYAGVCHDVYSAERLQKSNSAQIITLGARVVGHKLAQKIVTIWLESEFIGGRSLPKIKKLKEIEEQSFA